MSLLEQLYHWRNILRCRAADPAFIPLTHEEISVISADRSPYTLVERFIIDEPPKIFGMDVLESPFGAEMRARQIDIPVTQISESTDVSYYHEFVTTDDPHRCRIHRRMVAHICHDTTEIKLTFEWDCFAKFKRALRITKWFPIKMRTAVIQGRVLYPYLKVSLPHNKHHVQFKHTQ